MIVKLAVQTLSATNTNILDQKHQKLYGIVFYCMGPFIVFIVLHFFVGPFAMLAVGPLKI